MKYSNVLQTLVIVIAVAFVFFLFFTESRAQKKDLQVKDDTIQLLQTDDQSKVDLLAKNKAQLDLQDRTISSLRTTLQSKEDLIAKNEALLKSKDETIQSLQDSVHSKDEVIAKYNGMMTSYQEQIAALEARLRTPYPFPMVINPHFVSQPQEVPPVEADDGRSIFPADNGFESQDLGTGFGAYQVFGPLKNPTFVAVPEKIANKTPWKFGDGNSGIAANNSGFYVSHASNGDSDGAKSTSGQAGYLQFKGSSISQSITLPVGKYRVTFKYEARRDYAPGNQISVSLDDTVLFKGSPTNYNNFEQVTTDSISISKTGKHLLVFRGLGGKGDELGDHTTFIDDIRIRPAAAPELAPANTTTSEIKARPRVDLDAASLSDLSH